ncbi:Glutathione-dependent formaldehyde-activating enzyme [Loktanella fryxellensis]|uniref:Glutathione-dependent formaldehyde-activating enzyme n=1 Tax=Loktanella fryxellensis TaxID=245187 RepID=A0A1H7YDN1_9RHOB|nr:GFA family protein [Loktanella fryxellensis]SEM44240.1 Glutathione-dependent formaldehyde-activating enzyme [Loktanella fryxellensis]
MSASAYSLSAIVPEAGFDITAGKTTRGGRGTGPLDHRFCPRCMTWICTRIAGMGDMVNVRPTLFNDTTRAAPFVKTMIVDRMPFAVTGAAHSYAGFPAEADFPALMAAYAAQA